MTEIEARSVGYLTNLAGRLLARALARRLDGIGLSIGHMPVLAALSEGAAMTQKDLAAQAVVEQPTMAATLSRMERDGLIRRIPNPDDARSTLVSLTPAAVSKMKDLNAAILEVNAIATSTMSKLERAEYRRLIGKIIAALEQASSAGND